VPPTQPTDRFCPPPPYLAPPIRLPFFIDLVSPFRTPMSPSRTFQSLSSTLTTFLQLGKWLDHGGETVVLQNGFYVGRSSMQSKSTWTVNSLPRWIIRVILPLFVFPFFRFCSCSQPFPQAISPRDLESLHRHLLARYDIQEFDNYIHILALYRNNRAIEAQNARRRYTELSEASTSIQNAWTSIMRRLHERHSNPPP
jgi:hypothetical protein